MNKKQTLLIGFSSVLMLFSILETYAQDPTIRYGTGVPPTVRSINDRSLRYLANTQLEDGSWPGGQKRCGNHWDLCHGIYGEWRGSRLRSLCHAYP